MTFPSSPIPEARQTTWSVVSMYEANKPYNTPWIVYATRFPVLRSTPLWSQTWISVRVKRWLVNGWPADDVDEGHWFPPLRCGPNGFGDARKKLYTYMPGIRLERLFSSPHCRCATCLDNAQMVELMLVGLESIGRADAWPDEHRCYWREPDGRQRFDCTCGMPYSWLNVGQWYLDEHMTVLDWAWKNRCANGDVFDFASLTNSISTTCADLTIENLLEAQRVLAERVGMAYGLPIHLLTED